MGGVAPYASRVFKGITKLAARLDFSRPSLTIDLKNRMLDAIASSMSTWNKRPLDSLSINWNSAQSNRVLGSIPS
jgi:hypothetical protein